MGAESNTGRESHLSGTAGLYRTGPGCEWNSMSTRDDSDGANFRCFNLPDDTRCQRRSAW